jgi:MarR family 2-MHQ and catechol resistance regulon transcriptional repressor
MGSHYQGTDREVRALDAYIKLLRAAESLSGRMSHHLAEHHLTLSQFGVLEVLLHLGPLSQRELGQKLLKSSGNVTMVIDNLEKQGLVRRQRENEDRRVVTVHLTREGRRVIRELFPHHLTGIVAEMEILTAQEQETLGRLCRKVGLRR